MRINSSKSALWLLAAATLAQPLPALAETARAGDGQAAAAAGHRAKALQCMTMAIAYEAGHEPVAGQEAVAEVIINRSRHPAYPRSVCGVVFQGSSRRTGCQFTFTCDGSLRKRLSAQVLAGAAAVADRAIAGQTSDRVGGATHYHANYVSPYWAPSLIRIGRIGAHIFYRAPGAEVGQARYAGGAEPEPGRLGGWLHAPDALTLRGTSSARPQVETPIRPGQPAVTFAPWGLTPQ